MRRIGLEGESAELWGSGVIGIVQFLAVLPAILYIDRLGEFFASKEKSCELTRLCLYLRKKATSSMYDLLKNRSSLYSNEN